MRLGVAGLHLLRLPPSEALHVSWKLGQVAVYALFIIICYERLLFTISRDLTYIRPWLLFLVTLSALQTSWLVLLSYRGGTGLCDFMEPECDLPSSLPLRPVFEKTVSVLESNMMKL